MGRPDYGQIARQHRSLAHYVGETAIRRAYVSSSAGQQQYGIDDSAYYAEHVVTGLFAPLTFAEIQQGGGQYYAGDVFVTLFQTPIRPGDEVRWSGIIFRAEGSPQPLQIGGRSASKILLRRGDVTG